MIFHTARADVSPDDIPQWAIKLIAIVAVFVVTILCVATRSLGTHTAVVFTTIKVVIHLTTVMFILTISM